LGRMTEQLRFTGVFEETDEGWIAARILEIPGVHSQGRTVEEARANVTDALREVLDYRRGAPDLQPGAVVESVDITVG